MIIFWISQKDESSRVGDDDDDRYGIKYNLAVRSVLGHNRKKNDEFTSIITDIYSFGKINRFYDPCYEAFLNRIKERVKEVLKGHTDLILRFNSYLPKKLHFTLPLQFESETTGKKVKVEENCELPWDALDIISKTLDFDSHFQFAAVCKSWRGFHKIFWRNFLALQEPILLQFSIYGKGYGKGSFSFISIPDQKVYCSEMMKYFLHNSIYVTSSSGYFIFEREKSFMLINPFTRIKKVIDTSTCEFNSYDYYKHALLAFSKCSEEFVLVVLYKYNMSLHVYQSRNREWVTYPTMENLGKVRDFVVLHDKIYVVTGQANIGVLDLNYATIKFLNLKTTPDAALVFDLNLKLVNCDEQLLVVELSHTDKIRNVYKIDFSTMNYVRLETLGNIALFYAMGKQCYALSNPNMWGYESNSVYVISRSSTKDTMYLRDDKKLHKDIMLPAPLGPGPFKFDWYFRHLQYKVDYSLVE